MSDAAKKAGKAGGTPAGQGFSLREFLTVFFRDVKIYAVVGVIPISIAMPMSMHATKTYMANATLVVRVGKEYLYRPEVTERNDAPVAVTFENTRMLKAETEILGSRDLAEATLNVIGTSLVYPELVGNDPGNLKAVAMFQGSLLIETPKDTNLIEVSFTHRDPALSAYIVNTLIAEYLDKRARIFADPRYAFIKQQGEILKKKLQEYEEMTRNFKRENGIANFERQRDTLILRREETAKLLNGVVVTLRDSEARMAAMQRARVGMPETAYMNTQQLPDDFSARAKAVWLEMLQKEQDKKAIYQDTMPVVQDAVEATRVAKKEYEESLKQHKNIVTTGRVTFRDELDANIVKLQGAIDASAAMRDEYQRQVEDLTKQINTLSEKEDELHQLEAEKAALEESYQNYFRKTDQARIEEQAANERSQSVRVVQQALVPFEAKSSKKNIVIGGVVGSLVGIVLTAFMRETMRDTFITPEQLSRSLGLRVLSFFPHRDFVPKKKGLERYKELFFIYREKLRAMLPRLRALGKKVYLAAWKWFYREKKPPEE